MFETKDLINLQNNHINHKSYLKNCVFTQAVRHLACMGIVARNYVQQTAETMFVTYKKEIVLDVNQDGWTQLVIQV